MNSQKGVFSNVNDAIYAATSSFKLYSKLSLRDKEEVIREDRHSKLRKQKIKNKISYRVISRYRDSNE